MSTKEAVYVIGLKWFDRVNGNTYNNPVIIYNDGSKESLGSRYGYGRSYYHDAIEYLKENNINVSNNIGSSDLFVTRKQEKEGL